MRIIKRLLLGLVALWGAYVGYLYATSPRITYLIPKGYEGRLVLVANQPHGLDLNRRHAVYDFTHRRVIRLQGDLLTGFFPWGTVRYYAVDDAGRREELETLDESPDQAEAEATRMYVWGQFHQVGSYEARDGRRTTYESVLVSKAANVTRCLNQ